MGIYFICCSPCTGPLVYVKDLQHVRVRLCKKPVRRCRAQHCVFCVCVCHIGSLDCTLQLSSCLTDSYIYLELYPMRAIVKQLSVLKPFLCGCVCACLCVSCEGICVRPDVSKQQQFANTQSSHRILSAPQINQHKGGLKVSK